MFTIPVHSTPNLNKIYSRCQTPCPLAIYHYNLYIDKGSGGTFFFQRSKCRKMHDVNVFRVILLYRSGLVLWENAKEKLHAVALKRVFFCR